MRFSSVFLAGLGCALAILAACRPAHIPPVILGDAGPDDSGPPRDLDSDGDGLCDVNEIERRTDPFSNDSDGDGFSDYVEAQNGSQPNSIDTPDRTILVSMSDAPTGSLDTPLAFEIRGVGETFAGEFIPIRTLIVDDGSTARSFYAGGRAAGASPMENVRGGVMDERYLGVIGRTLLAFSLRFVQTQESRGCMRAYPFVYTLKEGDGALRASTTRWLLIAPPGMQPGMPGARWCGPATAHCL